MSVMEKSFDQERLGYQWFFGAGLVAIAFAMFLACMDQVLSTSTREIEVKKVIREIRTAQTSLGSRVTDDRQVRSGSEQDSPQE